MAIHQCCGEVCVTSAKLGRLKCEFALGHLLLTTGRGSIMMHGLVLGTATRTEHVKTKSSNFHVVYSPMPSIYSMYS